MTRRWTAGKTASPVRDRPPIALITGASRGIGAATARLLAAEGYGLVLASRSVAALENLAAELSASGAECLVVPTDVRDPRALDRLASQALDRFGRVDVLLNNAGLAHPGIVVSELSDAQIAESVETNLLAPIALTRRLLPHMLERGSGFIGFVTSVGGHIAIPSAALYSTTKFALRGFAGALRREVADSGVAVSIISPGFVDTELTKEVPRIFGRLKIRMCDADQVARLILRAIRKPRREYMTPAYYRLHCWIERSALPLADFVAALYMRRILPKYRKRTGERGVG